MEILRAEGLSFSYPDAPRSALSDVSFAVEQGSFVTLCGSSGSGKSTLLRHFKRELAPNGRMSGHLFFDGKPLESLDVRTLCSRIGFIAQNSADQIVTDRVWHELAFGLESLGFSNDTIRARVAEISGFFGIADLFHKHTDTLSGGQEQLVCLASVMVLEPDVLLLDEPTAKLDPIAAGRFLQTLARLNRELGTTIILSEQRVAEAFPLSDRVLVMDNGRLVADDTPRAVAHTLFEQKAPLFDALPTPLRVYCAVEGKHDEHAPLTEREGRAWLEKKTLSPLPPLTTEAEEAPCALKAEKLFFRYEKNAPDVLKDFSLTLHMGEIYALFGANGVGKSTALSVLAGLKKPTVGRIDSCGERVCLLPQEPCDLFCEKTVRRDLLTVADAASPERFSEIVSLCDLEPLLDRHPYDLSGGERQRAALAKVLLTGAKILLLDEPTKGMDAPFKRKLTALLANLKSEGYALLLVSHDIEFCATVSDRCGMFFDGSIVSEASTRRFLAGNRYYTTSAHRLASPFNEQAVTDTDILCALGVEPSEKPSDTTGTNGCEHENVLPPTPPPSEPKKVRRAPSAYGVWTLLAGAFTVLCGLYLFDDRKYYFISLLLILEMLFPFFLSFEKRKPPARELALLAALSALGVAGRAAFFMLPEFKPVAAFVITVGLCFGCEYGCIVGALSAFLSNFFFGQGPWTPWQMFAFGLVGALSGLMFYGRKRRVSRVLLTVFGFLTVLVLYGGVMDISAVLMAEPYPTVSALTASLIAGIPVNLLHAGATALFLFFLAEPFADKFDRIRIKYGIGA